MTFPHRPTLSVLAALIAACACHAAQVEIHLQSGQVVKGELVSRDDAQVAVKTTFAGKTGPMSATMTYPMSTIREIIELPDPAIAYLAKAKAATTATEHHALAVWCREQQLIDQAVLHARTAVDLDDQREDSRALIAELGWVKADGTWVRETDWLAAQGKVRYQGKVMTTAEAAELKAKGLQAAALRDAERKVDEATAWVANVERQIAELDKRPAAIDADLAKAQADAVRIDGAKAEVAATRKAVDDLESKAAMEGRSNDGRTFQPIRPELQLAIEQAQRAHNAAKRAASTADGDAARVKARIAALEGQRQNWEKQRTDLVGKQTKAVNDLAAARARLEELKKPSGAATPGGP